MCVTKGLKVKQRFQLKVSVPFRKWQVSWDMHAKQECMALLESQPSPSSLTVAAAQLTEYGLPLSDDVDVILGPSSQHFGFCVQLDSLP